MLSGAELVYSVHCELESFSVQQGALKERRRMMCGGQPVLLRMQTAISGKKGFIKSQGLWPEL